MSRVGLLLVLALGCGHPPEAGSPQDTGPRGTIQGQVVYSGTARGNVVLWLAKNDEPPKTFTVVPQAKLFIGETGPFSAPFYFTLQPAGKYHITAVLDRDTCADGAPGCHAPDLDPAFTVTREPNEGDILAQYADTVTLAVPPGAKSATPVAGINVGLTDDAKANDRPVFSVLGHDDSATSLGDDDLPLVLISQPLRTNQGVNEGKAAFLVGYVDDDKDGKFDDADHDGKPDLHWPTIIVRKLSDARQDDIRDEDPNSAHYSHVDPKLDGGPVEVVLAAGVDLSRISPKLDRPGALTELPIVIQPKALDAKQGMAPLKSVPKGRYAIIVEQTAMRQTWRLPNELAPRKPDPTEDPTHYDPTAANDFGFHGVVGQGFYLNRQ